VQSGPVASVAGVFGAGAAAAASPAQAITTVGVGVLGVGAGAQHYGHDAHLADMALILPQVGRHRHPNV
jgi:hypothetical protein